MTVNIIIAGVGGQGTILASRIIADAAIADSPSSRVRVGETFGAAMRNGAVSSHIRIGQAISPLIPKNGCDLIIGLEPLESLRLAGEYLAPGGTVVTNTERILPIDVKIGIATYPELIQIKDAVSSMGGTMLALDGSGIAQKLGSPRFMNVVMLGAAHATGLLPISRTAMLKAIKGRVPPRTTDANLRAFEAGQEALPR